MGIEDGGDNNGGRNKGTDIDIYWRDKSVRDRLGFALENDKIYKDVEFIVGVKEVRMSAHKLILRLSSLVFENLITSHEEQGLMEIRLPNTSPPAFRRLLKFIYTDHLEMYDLLHFLEVARDFGFQKLPEQSIKILKKTEITPLNAVFILDIAKGLGDDELEQNALHFILNNAKEVLESDSFTRLSYVGLCQILRDDRLATDELTVFQATFRWAECKCKRSQIPVTGENIRTVLKDARLYIRYTLMGYDQILSEVKTSGLLLSSEFVQVLKYFMDPSITILNIPTKPRAFRANLPQKPVQNESTMQYNRNSVLSSPTLRVKIDRANVFRLQLCSMEFRDVLHALELRYTVEEINLQDLQLRNPIHAKGRRIYMPNLESFQFFQSKTSSCRKLPDKSFMQGLTLKDFLFFDKEKLTSWSLSDLWSLGVEVLIDVKGLRLVDLNPNLHEKKLTLAYPDINEADLILKSLGSEPELKSLCLMNCNLNHPDLIQSSHLETLVLQGVEFANSQVARDFINQFPNLRNISVFIENGISVNFQSDLMQRNSIVKLALAKVNLGTYKRKKAVIPFSVLEELYLDVCAWPPSIADQFSTLFPSLRKIAIRSKDQCRPSARIFKDILEIKTLEQIAIFRYPGKEDGRVNPNINIFIPPAGVNKVEVHRFLLSAGVVFGGTEPDVPDFVIRKSKETGMWGVDWEMSFNKLHFSHCMLEEFFSDQDVSKLTE